MTTNNNTAPLDKPEPTFQELLPLITDPVKASFLRLLPFHHYIDATAAAVGINRHTAFYWLRHDDTFASAYTALKKEEDPVWLEKHLENLRSIAFDTKTPPQTRLLGSFFEVKKLDPSYRDNPPDSKFVGEITIKLAMPVRTYLEPLGEVKGPKVKLIEEGSSKDKEQE